MGKRMAFYKKTYKQLSKLCYPQSVFVGSTVTADQIAKRLAAESTMSLADVKAVLEALSGVMGDYMAQGRSVELDGIGSFFFQSSATGNGVKKAEKVSANLINGVKVRFILETTYKRGDGS
jgi:predicted histone-like DNA-binding protein